MALKRITVLGICSQLHNYLNNAGSYQDDFMKELWNETDLNINLLIREEEYSNELLKPLQDVTPELSLVTNNKCIKYKEK